jgi:hypothetical protein
LVRAFVEAPLRTFALLGIFDSVELVISM